MVRRHDVGLRLSLLDLLPDPSQSESPTVVANVEQ